MCPPGRTAPGTRSLPRTRVSGTPQARRREARALIESGVGTASRGSPAGCVGDVSRGIVAYSTAHSAQPSAAAPPAAASGHPPAPEHRSNLPPTPPRNLRSRSRSPTARAPPPGTRRQAQRAVLRKQGPPPRASAPRRSPPRRPATRRAPGHAPTHSVHIVQC